jgi:uncharacterized protein DUF397
MNGMRGGHVPPVTLHGLAWRKSRRCQNGECVEVATWGNRVLVRTSLEPHRILEISLSQWEVLIGSLLADKDHPEEG